MKDALSGLIVVRVTGTRRCCLRLRELECDVRFVASTDALSLFVFFHER